MNQTQNILSKLTDPLFMKFQHLTTMLCAYSIIAKAAMAKRAYARVVWPPSVRLNWSDG